jgi:L-alanine-DL-glutamate epimerase-like enolase superfamily enzyme
MIEDVELFRLEVPLRKPYKLAFGPVHHFDTILVRVIADGRAGFGEATILTGYTDEDIEGGWRLAQSLAGGLPGLSLPAAKATLADRFTRAPFTATAFTTAIEMCEGSALLDVPTSTEVLVLAGIEETTAPGLEAEIERLLAAGFRTLKVKVGFDPDLDAARVRSIQRLVRGRAQLRIDANQGYSPEQACRFARSVDPEGTELFEQPCAAADWEAVAIVANASPLPLMLDESIYGEADIERAAALKSIAFIKLKLMKLGSLERLALALERIRELGMEPVLGNGVATEVGCWMEACVARSRIRNPGEMNGFLRQRIRLAPDCLAVRRGHLVLDKSPVLDMAAVASLAVGRTHCTRQPVLARGWSA